MRTKIPSNIITRAAHHSTARFAPLDEALKFEPKKLRNLGRNWFYFAFFSFFFSSPRSTSESLRRSDLLNISGIFITPARAIPTKDIASRCAASNAPREM